MIVARIKAPSGNLDNNQFAELQEKKPYDQYRTGNQQPADKLGQVGEKSIGTLSCVVDCILKVIGNLLAHTGNRRGPGSNVSDSI